MIHNMKKYLLNFAVMLMGTSLLTGCLGSNSDDNSQPTEIVVTKGVLVINNGNVSSSIDGSLTFIDFSTDPFSVQQNVFKMANGRSLGGTPNDVMVYGSKIYITGSDENAVFVLDKKTFRLIEQISTTDEMGDAEGVNPRCLEGYENKVYVSTYGGYVGVIDTTSLAISNMYKVGSAPEGLALGATTNGSTTEVSLYVANSDYGWGEGSISKINLSSGSVTEIKNASIRNPQEIAVAGDILYVLDWGYYDPDDDWKQHEAGVYMVNGSNVTKVIPDATGMAASGTSIVTYNYPYGSSGVTYSIFNIVYGTLSNFYLSGGNPIVSPSAISIDPNSGYLYVASRSIDPDTGYPSYTTPGFMNIYDGSGQFVGSTSYATGVEPHVIAFSYGTTKLMY